MSQVSLALPGVIDVDRSGRDPKDRYYTPRWCVDLVLGLEDEKLRTAVAAGMKHGVLEPSAGGGALLRGLARSVDWLPNGYRPRVVACDLDPDPRPEACLGFADVEWRRGDFFSQAFRPHEFGLAILNPPFSLGEAFVRRCRQVSRWALALLRLPFLETQERSAWLASDAPDVFVLARRPQYYRPTHATSRTGGPSSQDTVTSAWMLWGPTPRAEGRVRVLP